MLRVKRMDGKPGSEWYSYYGKMGIGKGANA